MTVHTGRTVACAGFDYFRHEPVDFAPRGLHFLGKFGPEAPSHRPEEGFAHRIVVSLPDMGGRMTAPELPGALQLGEFLRSKKILPAIAHTDAIYEEVIEAYENGYTLATHLYSAMSGVTRSNARRYAGVVESAFLIDEMDVEIIADGVHLPAPLLQLICKIKGCDKIALITDAIRAAAMPPGESVIGNIHTGIKVIVEDGVSKLPDRSSFAGSVATADRLVRTMTQMAGISLPDAVRMITHTPATIMDIADRKGSLAAGKDADIIIFDENITVHATMVHGKIIYQNDSRL